MTSKKLKAKAKVLNVRQSVYFWHFTEEELDEYAKAVTVEFEAFLMKDYCDIDMNMESIKKAFDKWKDQTK